MKKCLITGGAGFIGSHLADAILSRGSNVTVLDDLSTGDTGNILHLRNHPRFRFIKGSVLDERLVETLVRDADVVFHLAAVVGVKLVLQQPARVVNVNIRGTEVILEAASRFGSGVLIASTSEVYGGNGSPRRACFRETDPIALGSSRRWCYAASKAVNEYMAAAFHAERGLPVVICRYFNIVGPRQRGRYGMVIPRFFDWALHNDPILVYGDGTQSRAFTWIGDAVDATVRLMESPSAWGQVFNIGNEDTVMINDLAERVAAVTGSSSTVIHVPYEEAYGEGFEDIRCRRPDLSKLRAYIGYEPAFDLDRILEAVFEHHARVAGTIPCRAL